MIGRVVTMVEAEEIRLLLISENLIDTPSLSTDDGLVSTGLIDSMALVRLVGLIERRYNVSLSVHDMHAESFESCQTIAATIRRSSRSPLGDLD